ncbi:hypothetical protein Tco_1102826 [Tanacetum coccineum]
MVEVQLIVEHNILANEQQHSEQSESVYDTYLLEKVDRNTIPKSTDMSHKGGEIDQNADAEKCQEVNSRVKVQSPKTRNSNKPLEPKIPTQKPSKQIVIGHRFSPNKSSDVHEKTNTPRSCLRWIPTGRIFNIVGLRYVPTGKIFNSSTTRVDYEPPNGSNEYITNPYECDQTLNVSACTLNLSVGTSVNPKKGKTQSLFSEKSDISETKGSRNLLMINKNNGVCKQHFRPRSSKKRKVMASEHSSLEPVLHEMTPVTISSGLVLNTPSSTPFVPPSRTDWDILFQPLFDELLNPPSSVYRPTPEVFALITEVVTPAPAISTGSPSSTTIDQDAPSPSNYQITPETQSPVISNNVEEENHDLDVAHMNNILFFGIPIPENDSEASSTSHVIPTIVHTAAPNVKHVTKWIRDHPLDKIIDELERPVSTRYSPCTNLC